MNTEETPIPEPAQSLPARPDSMSRGFWLALLFIESSVLIVHLNGLRIDHAEGDEVIFTFLAERLAETPAAYHLQGAIEGQAARRFINETWEPLYNPKHPKTKKFASLNVAEVWPTPL